MVRVSAMGSTTATGTVDVRSFFVNYGRSAVSVAAPGVNTKAARGFTLSNGSWDPDIASWL